MSEQMHLSAGVHQDQIITGSVITFDKHSVLATTVFEGCSIKLRDCIRLSGCWFRNCKFTYDTDEILPIALAGNIFDDCMFDGELLQILLGHECCRQNGFRSPFTGVITAAHI